jgi:hypothetical protein
MRPTYISCLQELYRLQSLLDIWHLVFQARGSPLHVCLHELVLPDRNEHIFLLFSASDARYHLLETLQRRFDICSGGDVVFDFVDEWGIWDASWICSSSIFPVLRISSADTRMVT